MLFFEDSESQCGLDPAVVEFRILATFAGILISWGDIGSGCLLSAPVVVR